MAGGDFDGVFRRFAADIEFDPADLQGSRFRVEIDTTSADTGDADRDLALKGADFFAVERWPSARFSADRFVALGNGRFEALGRLTIRDRSREVRLPFSFKPVADGRGPASRAARPSVGSTTGSARASGKIRNGSATKSGSDLHCSCSVR